jgi:hypothetical protein
MSFDTNIDSQNQYWPWLGDFETKKNNVLTIINKNYLKKAKNKMTSQNFDELNFPL